MRNELEDFLAFLYRTALPDEQVEPNFLLSDKAQQRLEEPGSPRTQAAYERVLELLAEIRLGKVRHYGESRYRPTEPRYNLSLQYGDLERKMLRFKNVIYGDEKIDEEAIKEIAKNAVDMANYGVMMIEVCWYLLCYLDEQEVEE